MCVCGGGGGVGGGNMDHSYAFICKKNLIQ